MQYLDGMGHYLGQEQLPEERQNKIEDKLADLQSKMDKPSVVSLPQVVMERENGL